MSAAHHSTSASSSPVQAPSRAADRQRRRMARTQQQATTIAASRNGPAATFPPVMWGASGVHSVGWLMTGESGWLVTAVYVACQFAASAAPSSTTEGSAARTRNSGTRRHGRTATSTGNARSTSGCTHMAAPVCHAARDTRPWLIASTAYSSSPTATASSGCPHRPETFHSATAPAAASSARRPRDTPSRSASASAANSGTHEIAIWYGPASTHTAGCRLCGPGIRVDRPVAAMITETGSRITAAPGSDTSPVGWV